MAVTISRFSSCALSYTFLLQ